MKKETVTTQGIELIPNTAIIINGNNEVITGDQFMKLNEKLQEIREILGRDDVTGTRFIVNGIIK